MIYIGEKDFGRQIELLSFLAERGDYVICAWLYPEAQAKDLAGFAVIDGFPGLVPPTAYGNDHVAKCTEVVSASEKTLEAFSNAKTSVMRNCDSVALYQRNQLSWAACVIGHEGICLIQDDSLLNELVTAGFNACLKAPRWW